MVLEATDSRRSPAAGAGAAVHGHQLSTVVPSSVTGEAVDYELADADLLHKLHYVRAAHYFRPGDAVRGLTTRALKEPMFPWLDMYFPVSGRLRRRAGGEGEATEGRPYVRCNDCGVRIVEATCDATVDQWLEELPGATDRAKLVTYDKVIGPELFFSPLLYVQDEVAECAKIISKEATAGFMGFCMADGSDNKRKRAAAGLHSPPPRPSGVIGAAGCFSCESSSSSADSAVASSAAAAHAHADRLMRSDMRRQHRRCRTSCVVRHRRVEFFFPQQLKGLQLHAPVGDREVGPFELISALMWQALAKIRDSEDTSMVTVVVADASARSGRELSNDQRFGHVLAGSSPAKTDVAELAVLLANAHLDEADVASAAAAGADVVLYGANLTFVDIAEVDVYGMELRGQRPAHVEYAVDGVGDGGAAVMHRDAGGRGRTVTAVVRRHEVDDLRAALRDALGVA